MVVVWFFMDTEKVWDEISGSWNDFRVDVPSDVSDFFYGRKGKILDLGCGSGRNFLKIDGVELYGVDFSGKMLEFAKAKADSLGLDVELKKAEVFDTGFSDDFFDSVLFYAVLHCVDSAEKRKKTLEEIYRILKTGGEVFVSSWGRKQARLKNNEKECFVPWTLKNGEKFERYTYIFDLKELEDLVKEVGFEIVKSWEDNNVCLVLKKVL